MKALEQANTGESLTQLFFGLGRLLEDEMEAQREAGNRAALETDPQDLPGVPRGPDLQRDRPVVRVAPVGRRADAHPRARPIAPPRSSSRVLKDFADNERIARTKLKLSAAYRGAPEVPRGLGGDAKLIEANPRALDFLMEQCQILEDWAAVEPGYWNVAIDYWSELAKKLQAARPRPPEYYDCWYHVAFCQYRQGQQRRGPQDDQERQGPLAVARHPRDQAEVRGAGRPRRPDQPRRLPLIRRQPTRRAHRPMNRDRSVRIRPLSLLVALLLAADAAADEVVLVPDSTIAAAGGRLRGKIERETPEEVVIAGRAVPLDQIAEVSYDAPGLSFTQAASRSRTATSQEAADLYEKAVGEASSKPLVAQAARYRRAAILARLAQSDPSRRDAALQALRTITTELSTSRHLGPALERIARLELDARDFDAADQALQDLAKLSLGRRQGGRPPCRGDGEARPVRAGPHASSKG